MEQAGVSVREYNESKNSVYRQAELKQKGVKQVGHKIRATRNSNASFKTQQSWAIASPAYYLCITAYYRTQSIQMTLSVNFIL